MLELRADDHVWSADLHQEHSWAIADARMERLLPVIAGTLVLVGDLLIVGGAFLLAYWARFVAPDALDIAIGANDYVRMSAIIAVLSAVLFANHGLFNL